MLYIVLRPRGQTFKRRVSSKLFMNISECTNRNCKCVSLDALTMEGSPPPRPSPTTGLGGGWEGVIDRFTTQWYGGGGLLTRGRSTLKYNDHTE